VAQTRLAEGTVCLGNCQAAISHQPPTLVTYFGVPSIATMFSFVFIFLFSFYTPLHISALMSHLQVQYTQSFMEAIAPTTDPFLCYAQSHLCACSVSLGSCPDMQQRGRSPSPTCERVLSAWKLSRHATAWQIAQSHLCACSVSLEAVPTCNSVADRPLPPVCVFCQPGSCPDMQQRGRSPILTCALVPL
jgi:hypothetical protein